MEHANEHTAIPEGTVCATCAQPLHGPYCASCGEKKLDKHDRRIAHIFEEFFHSLTHADGKFLRSLKYLLTRPGFLTTEYLAGRRKPYSSPLSLFFIANLIYLLAAPYDTFNSRFTTVIEGQPYSASLVPQVEKKMEQRQWTHAQMEERYDEKSTHEAKLILIAFVFLLSIPVGLLFISRRHYYFDYFIFSMEYFNFIMYFIMMLLPYSVGLIFYIIKWMKHGAPIHVKLNATVLYSFLLLLLCSYLAIAARRVFNQPWWLTIIKAAALTMCTVFVMFLYRYLAFEVTMALL